MNTMKSSTQDLRIRWKENKPTIKTLQLKLRPIEEKDLEFYQNLFANQTAMSQYLGGVRFPEQTKSRFNIWLDRWNKHPFSALAVMDKIEKKVIGHAVLGHGDYTGDPKNGWSEIAFIIDPAYWNSKHTLQEIGGEAGKQRIGTEVVMAIVFYAKDLFDKKILVPVDVTETQESEVLAHLESGEIKEFLKNQENKISTVFIPLTSIRATSMKSNTAGYKILKNIFALENKGSCTAFDSNRDLFEMPLNPSL